MSAQHYFNSSGEWIAFRRYPDDRYLFDRAGKWIGWFPWRDNEAVDLTGRYFGTVIDGDRLYRRTSGLLNRERPGHPGHPGHVGYAGYPGRAAYSRPPFGFEDVLLAPPPLGRSVRA